MGPINSQAIEGIFSHKKNKPVHPPLFFNGIPVKRESQIEHLVVILDELPSTYPGKN